MPDPVSPWRMTTATAMAVVLCEIVFLQGGEASFRASGSHLNHSHTHGAIVGGPQALPPRLTRHYGRRTPYAGPTKGIRCDRKRVARLMRRAKLRGCLRGRKMRTTHRRPSSKTLRT